LRCVRPRRWRFVLNRSVNVIVFSIGLCFGMNDNRPLLVIGLLLCVGLNLL
jgi:hypothetical protein